MPHQLALAYDNPTPPPKRTGPRPPVFYILPPRKPTKRHLARFYLLSILLHVLVIILFGAPTGGSREGRAMWGSLQVVDLPAPPREAAPKLKIDTMLSAPATPAKTATQSRRAAPKPITPAEPRIESRPLPAPQPTIQPYSFPPLLDRVLTPELKLEKAPVLKVPPPTPVQVPPSPLPDPPKAEEPPPPAVVAPPAPLPPPVMERAPVQAPIVPVVPPAPIVAPELPPPAPPPVQAAPVQTPAVPIITTPPVERPPVEVPVLPVPSVESVAPTPRVEPAPKPVEQPPQEIPVAPKPPTALERALEREPPPKTEAAPPQAEPPARVEPRVPLPRDEPSLRPSPFTGPSSGPAKRGDEPTTTYDPTAAPSVDLDAIRRRAGQIAKEGSGRRALLPFPMPPVPAKKSEMEIAIENARKPDCRTAYQGLGLAAVVPLIANEFGEGNCRW